MNVLITGGLGFLGSNLAHHLVSTGHAVTILDSLLEGLGGNEANVESIKDKITIVKKDVRDPEAVKEVIKDKEVVFHFAGQVDHQRSIEQPFEDVDVRINGTLTVLEALKNHNPKAKMVFSSTRAVYGEVDSVPVSEDAPTNPKGMYAITSLAAEKMVLMYHQLYGIPCTILRMTNTYGPRHQMKKGYGVVNYFLRQGMDGNDIQVMGDGNVLRDYLFVDDASEAFVQCATNDKTNGKVLNIGTGNGTSFEQLAKEVSTLTGAKTKNIPYPAEVKHIEPGNYVADCSQIHQLTGWKAKTSLIDGLKKTFEFYKENKDKYW